MFDNIGEKIKHLAIASTIIGCILSLAGSIYYGVVYDEVFVPMAILIVGCLISWVSSFVLYGFGELIIQTTNISKGNQRMQALTVYKDSNKKSEITKQSIDDIKDEIIEDYERDNHDNVNDIDDINTPNEDECPCCFNKINANDKECSFCGYKLK
ncbi:MAG: hypothetical protein IJZ73_02030 [Clostridia bacterium]|nr:hypothetical protein [Clostridia bacterium]